MNECGKFDYIYTCTYTLLGYLSYLIGFKGFANIVRGGGVHKCERVALYKEFYDIHLVQKSPGSIVSARLTTRHVSRPKLQREKKTVISH